MSKSNTERRGDSLKRICRSIGELRSKMNEETAFKGIQDNYKLKLKGAQKLQEDLKNLLKSGKNSDVVFKVEGREFKAHRSILSARSSFFSAMFDHDTSEKRTGIVTIEDADPDSFEGLLQFIYTGATCFSTESVVHKLGLYIVADRYQELELKEECARQIKSSLSVGSFCDIVRMSLLYPELKLTDTIDQYFVKNASDIVSQPEWEKFVQENPKVCNNLFCQTLKSTSRKESKIPKSSGIMNLDSDEDYVDEGQHSAYSYSYKRNC